MGTKRVAVRAWCWRRRDWPWGVRCPQARSVVAVPHRSPRSIRRFGLPHRGWRCPVQAAASTTLFGPGIRPQRCRGARIPGGGVHARRQLHGRRRHRCRGGYAMANMQPGPYGIKVSSVKPRPAQWATRWSGNAVRFTSAAIVNLGNTPTTFNVRLLPGTTVTGRVVTGWTPQARVKIRRCGGSFLDCAETTTDARGFYSFAGVPAEPQQFTMFKAGAAKPLVPIGRVPRLVGGRAVKIDLRPVASQPVKKVNR